MLEAVTQKFYISRTRFKQLHFFLLFSCVTSWTEFTCPVSSNLFSVSLNLTIAGTLGKQ